MFVNNSKLFSYGLSAINNKVVLLGAEAVPQVSHAQVTAGTLNGQFSTEISGAFLRQSN